MASDERPPAFLFYVNDFASDGLVEAMTTEGVGAYILLLCKAWREDPPGTIPNDDSILARWARLEPNRWSELRSVVLAPFSAINDGTRLAQKRMQKEYRKMVEKTAERRRSAKAAANTRWRNSYMQTQCERIANAHMDENEIEDAFEDFWQRFPKRRRKSKGSAREAFRKALRKVDLAVLLEAASAYAASDKASSEWVQMPSSWLNQECWNDSPESWADLDKPKEGGYRQVPANEFKELLRLSRFSEGPIRNRDNPQWVYGTLRDGTKVECKDFPVKQEA